MGAPFEPFIGSEAVAAGRLTKYDLSSKLVAVHRDIYVPRGTPLTAVPRAQAAWLWSRRRGVVAGQSAAALHRAKWVDDRGPAQLLYDDRRPPKGVTTWSDRVEDDEVQLIAGMRVTTPARTALDLACRYPLGKAVAAIDALARATHLKMTEVELLAQRYRGRRGIRRARVSLDLVNAGADSPRETWVRLLLIRAGFPRPQTQIPVYDEYGQLAAVIDLGWEDIKVGVDYEGEHHRTTRLEFNKGIRRHEMVTGLGWLDVRVTVEDCEAAIIGRVAAAWERRGVSPPNV